MNYIEVELLRQRAVLARLLLGVPAEAGAEGGNPAWRRITADAAGEGGASGEALPGGVQAAGGSGEASFPGGKAPGVDGMSRGVPSHGNLQALAGQQTAELRLMAMSPEAAEQGSHAASGGRSVTGGGRAVPPAGDHFGVGDVARSSLLTVLPGRDTPVGEQASARTVSLWAERDARRYDGSFCL